MSLRDKIDSKEDAVDAGITKVQGVLEELKASDHSVWILLVLGIIMFVVGLVIWLI